MKPSLRSSAETSSRIGLWPLAIALAAIAAVACLALLYFWLHTVAAPDIVVDRHINKPRDISGPVIKLTATSADDAMFHATTDEAVNTDPETMLSTGMRQQLQQVAVQYAENMRYPAYSKPLQTSDWALLNPQAFISAEVPLSVGKGLSAEIKLPKYVISRDESLAVEVRLHGVSDGQAQRAQSVSVVVAAGSQSSAAVALGARGFGKGYQVFQGTVPAAQLDLLEGTEARLQANIHLRTGESASAVAAFRLVGNDAILTALGAPYVADSDLVIPASFEVSVPGYYQIRANLFDSASGAPVSHLNARMMLVSGQQSGELKVHASTLRASQSAGPYRLQDFQVIRSPAKPGDLTGYGKAAKEVYTIEGFPLEDYSDTPYENPQNQRRLDFLQKMAGEV